MEEQAYLAGSILVFLLLVGSLAGPKICKMFVFSEKKYEPKIRVF